MQSPTRTVPGTGLSPISYVLLITLSVGLFLFWGGPLWSAAREASHVGRFAYSYFLVIPAATALLMVARRWSWSHLIGATCSAWGIKLVITSALYFALARGTAFTPHAITTTPSKSAAALAPEYHAANGTYPSGSVKGKLVFGQEPVVGAAVLVDKPLPGKAVDAEVAGVTVKISAATYDSGLYTGFVGGDFTIESKDSVLHTFHLYDGARAVSNVPVPVDGKPHHVTSPEAGIYEARCDTHASERAYLVLADHPYLTRTDETGAFALDGIAAGKITLTVVAPRSKNLEKGLIRKALARVEASDTTLVHIDLSTPEAAEERL
ncbi:MAG: hypothetical protein IPK82_08255 [Polyangiaceae bacterium]|nr:hypothetical protein [Polyangiaceae bacterium]